jgi:hypothetical protein
MSFSLSNDDRCAVDLLLDRDQDGICYTQASSQNVESRLAAIENLLHKLDSMPHPDPSSDLVARTLARVDQDAQLRTVPGVPTQPIVTAR